MTLKQIVYTGSFAIALSLLLSGSSFAQGQTVFARSQLRRTVDPSPRSAFGTVLIKEQSGKQMFQVLVKRLGEDNFGVFLGDKSAFDTNCCLFSIDPLDRTDAKHGTWSRTLVGIGQAPQEFTNLEIPNLSDLVGSEIDISQPGIPNVTTLATNIVGGVTNIVGGVTNIVGTITNVIYGIAVPNPGQTGTVFSTLWAPLYAPTAKPGQLSYHRHSTLATTGPASPMAGAIVKIRFDGTTGRSVLDVRAVKLTRGQDYTVWIADRTNTDSYVMFPADKLAPTSLNSASARLLRDTKFADPLPQQVRDIGDLSNRIVEIRDEFQTVHLSGLMP